MKLNVSQQQNHHTLHLQQYQEQVECELLNKDPHDKPTHQTTEDNSLIAYNTLNTLLVYPNQYLTVKTHSVSSTGRYEIPNFISNQPIAMQLNPNSLKGTLSCNEAQSFTATEIPHIAAATTPGTSRKRIA
ncbi:hypothetical protein CDAR_622401 [Caerostris darwini]|uniref:Uncharacterized protein n=1 Tax=Caerostris darwini TaxID=1538125 RepID=A0AAV4W143_9ARAC|nr:hypothetical protein CDAR_622401 [Caerostris darwini]